MKNIFQSISILISSGALIFNVSAVEVNNSQELLEELTKTDNVTLNTDIIINYPIHLSKNQTLNGNGHILMINTTANTCGVMLVSGDRIINTNFISSTDNQDAVCGNNVNDVTINTSNIISSGVGSNGIVLNNSNKISISSTKIIKSGTGSAVLINNSSSVTLLNNVVTHTSTDDSVVFNNTINSNFIGNTVAISTGSTVTQVGIVGNGGNTLTISGNQISTASTNADAIRVVSGDNFVITNNKFILSAKTSSLAIGIFFGNNNEAVFNINNIIISNNDFSEFTLYNTGYFPALNFSATSVTSINSTLSLDNIIGPNQLYGGAEKGSIINGYVSFKDGNVFPKSASF